MDDKVKFYPTKKLFIETLTKDIEIEDCILELIDNAVDSYTRHNIKDRRRMDLSITSSSFTLIDNCGGISRKRFFEEVFRFGYAETNLNRPTIGMYGIGLKRSIFKLGNKIDVETDDNKNLSKIIIDVKKWMAQKDADWSIEPALDEKSKLGSRKKPYTRISVSNFYSNVKEVITSVFIEKLKQTIEIYYCHFIKNHIDIYVNRKKLIPFTIEINQEKDFEPAVKSKTIDGVKIKIICWVNSRERPRNQVLRGGHGWNIFMNKRLIIHDNVGSETGWTGESRKYLPKYHSIYNRFRGVVYLESNEPNKLPLNTSKSDFNKESMIYVRLLKEMANVARPIIDYLSRQYDKEKKEYASTENRLKDKIYIKLSDSEKQKPIPITKISKSSEFRYPSKKIEPKVTLSTISYKMDTQKIDELKKWMRVHSKEKLGVATFNYCYDVYSEDDNNE